MPARPRTAAALTRRAGPSPGGRASRPSAATGGRGRSTGLALGALALGPGLRRGFLLSYDMVAVPREPFTAAIARADRRARPGGAQRRGAGHALPGGAGRHRAEAPAADDLRAGLLGWGGPARPRALVRAAGRRGLLHLEPVRGRAAHPRPVGPAARLRRPALGAPRGCGPPGGLLARRRAAAGRAAAGRRGRVCGDEHLGAGGAARRRARPGRRARPRAADGPRPGRRAPSRPGGGWRPARPRWRSWARAACPGWSPRCCARCTPTRRG